MPAGTTPRSGRTALLALALLLGPAAGCSPGTPPLTAPPHASDAACVAALARLPGRVLDQARTPLDVAGAASWGEPAIVLRCGLPEVGATTLTCLSVNDVDWVVDDAADPLVFTTFGRSPAAQVRVPTAYGRENASAALVDLAPVAGALPRTSRACIGG
jgi:hypothetical protein